MWSRTGAYGHFVHYMKGVGSIRLFDRETSHRCLKDIAKRDYWEHITS